MLTMAPGRENNVLYKTNYKKRIPTVRQPGRENNVLYETNVLYTR